MCHFVVKALVTGAMFVALHYVLPPSICEFWLAVTIKLVDSESFAIRCEHHVVYGCVHASGNGEDNKRFCAEA